MKFAVYMETPSGLPMPRLELDSQETAITITRGLPGGYLACEIGYAYANARDQLIPAYLPNPVESFVPFAKVAVTAGSATLFEGRATQPKWPNGQITGFTCTGYLGALQEAVVDTSDTAVRTNGQLLRKALREFSPLVMPGNTDQLQDPSPDLDHALTEFQNMTLAQVVDQISKEGDGLGNVWDWAVRERTLWLFPDLPPDQPDYLIPIDQDLGEPTTSYDEVWTQARVVYRPEGATVDSVYPSSGWLINRDAEDLLGFSRQIVLQGGQLTDAGAERFLTAWMQLHSQPFYAIPVTRQNRGLERPGGAPVPPWLIREGEWVQIGENGPIQQIRQVKFTSQDMKAEIQLGRLAADQGSFFRKIRDAEALQRARINRVSGGKER